MKKKDLLSRLVTPTGTKGWASHVGAGCTFCPGCQTRDKRAPLLSRTGVPGWETGTTGGFPTGPNQRFCSSVQYSYARPEITDSCGSWTVMVAVRAGGSLRIRLVVSCALESCNLTISVCYTYKRQKMMSVIVSLFVI